MPADGVNRQETSPADGGVGRRAHDLPALLGTPPADDPPEVAGGISRPLHPTARRLLEAARRVLDRDGLDALSLKSVSREAGEHPSLIAYHFGDKGGLLLELVDSLVPRDEIEQMVTATSRLSPGVERVGVQCEGLKKIAEDRGAMLAFLDLLPGVVRNERLRPEMAALYEWYRGLNVRMLGLEVPPAESERMRYFGALVLAAVDGFAMQAVIDPDGFDLDAAFDTLAEVSEGFLGRHGGVGG